MADPSGSYTFADLILRVSTAAGIAYYGTTGQRRALIPVNNEYNFDLCKRIVNDGVKMFIAAAPYPSGWRWMRRLYELTFVATEITGTVDSATSTTLVDATLTATYDANDDLNGYWVYDTTNNSYAQITDYTTATGTCTVAAWLTLDGVTGGTTPAATDTYIITDVQCVEGDKARYPLPDDFGRPVGKITYTKDSSRSFVGWADEGQLRRNKEVTEFDSYPAYASARAYRKRKWEIVFDPSPSYGDTVVIPYEIGFDELELEGGLATSTSSTTLVNSSIANLYPDNYFNGWIIYIIDYTGNGSYATVTDFTGSTGTYTVAAWLAVDGVTTGVTPAATSAYYVEESTAKHPAGWQFDNAVLSACLAQAQIQIENMKGDYLNKFTNLDLAAAQLQDLRSAPLSLLKTSGDRGEYERRKSAVTYN
mgnify:CR=1 FL=1